ncbi:MAG TPA: hypothetical protein VIK13_15055, partial [Candidatus Limnocylindrales bacterium]
SQSGDPLSRDAWLIGTIDGSRSRIGAGYASLLGSGHGTVALVKAPPVGDAAATFVFWADGALTDAPLAGSPFAWSGDGSLLAVETAPGAPPSGQTGSTGGSQPARLVVLVRASSDRRLDSGTDLVDGRFPVSFSPDGTRLAATSASGGTLEFDLATGSVARLSGVTPFGWTPEGGLVLVAEGAGVRIRSADGTEATPQLPPGLPVYGPGGSVAVLDAGQAFGAGAITVGRSGTWRTVHGLTAGEGTPITWTVDGSRCFVASGTTDSSRDLDRVLLVTVP